MPSVTDSERAFCRQKAAQHDEAREAARPNDGSAAEAIVRYEAPRRYVVGPLR